MSQHTTIRTGAGKGLILWRSVKPHSWFGVINGKNVEFVPYLGPHSGKPTSWYARYGNKSIGSERPTLSGCVHTVVLGIDPTRAATN